MLLPALKREIAELYRDQKKSQRREVQGAKKIGLTLHSQPSPTLGNSLLHSCCK
jgi:hypothetical protein